jgi:hypothetical protein
VEISQVAMWRAIRQGGEIPPGRLTVQSLPF